MRVLHTDRSPAEFVETVFLLGGEILGEPVANEPRGRGAIDLRCACVYKAAHGARGAWHREVASTNLVDNESA